ncbi:MAG: NHLP bacteriocin export ABC transporter permease/ATPase subunit [Anaerolineales bacterium]
MMNTEPQIWEDFLLKLRYQKSRLVKAGTYTAHLLDDPQTAWLVYAGSVDVFSVALADGAPVGTRQHLFEVGTGTLLLGADLTGCARGMVVMQAPGAQLLRFERAVLTELGTTPPYQDIIAGLLEGWMTRLAELMTPKLAPKEFVALADTVTVQTHAVVRTLGRLRWARLDHGAATWSAMPPIPLGAEPVPLPRHAWLTVAGGSQLTALSTTTLLETPNIWEAVDSFGQYTIQQLATVADAQTQQIEQGLAQRIAADERHWQTALTRIAGTLNPQAEASAQALSTQTALLAACQRVGEALGIAVQAPPTAAGPVTLRTISQTSGFGTREVALAGAWWGQDGGPLLAYTEDGRHPVAVLPVSASRYALYDPRTGSTTPVSQAVADTLHPFGVQFYRPLSEPDTSPRGLLAFAVSTSGADLRAILLMGVALGLLNLSIPLGVGLLFTNVIPLGDASILVGVTGLLLLATAAMFATQLAQHTAVVRVESRADMTVLGALWFHLLRQRPTFFRQYSAGDLGSRFLAISQLRSLLGELVAGSLLNVFTLIFNFLLMLVLAPTLALVAAAMLGFAWLLMGRWVGRSLGYQHELNAIIGQNTGLVLGFINGIRKFRVAGAEKRIFAFWATQFSRQRRVMFGLRRLQNQVAVLVLSYPLLATIPVFILGAGAEVGVFAAFYVAFLGFMRAGLEMGSLSAFAAATIPLYRRALPILSTTPEAARGLAHPGELYGEIEASHVSFRYHASGPPVLQDVSFTVERGAFVAIVGASGSGKSTLLRVLLGFETPESGAVYYDGQDLESLDILAVRQQLGVVMQNAKLIAGADLFKNIVGIAPDLTLDDAWEAAEKVGLAADIRAMPMGMQTIVTEGGGTLSGGQQQRLLIATAIVHKPRIIYFDEATSALDNRTQQIVSQSLEQLDATRIVIAHRLSTVINADKIIVMDGGRVVQQGTYNSLMREDGPFAEMARRQMV